MEQDTTAPMYSQRIISHPIIDYPDPRCPFPSPDLGDQGIPWWVPLGDYPVEPTVITTTSGTIISSPERTPGSKDTNPKDVVGTKKAPISCVPLPVISEVGLAMLEGATKYGRHNWRNAGVRCSVYIDAVWRHMSQWWEGEDIDEDSGLSHITKAIATLVVLRDSMIQGNMVDDRPPSTESGWLRALNEKAAKVMERYKDCNPKHYTKQDKGDNQSV